MRVRYREVSETEITVNGDGARVPVFVAVFVDKARDLKVTKVRIRFPAAIALVTLGDD